MKPILLKLTALFFFFLTVYELQSQELLPLEDGQIKNIRCACKDTGNNIFAFSQKGIDTIDVHYFNIATQQWNYIFSKSGVAFRKDLSYPSCQVLSGNSVVIVGLEDSSSNFSSVIRFRNFSWNRIGRLSHSNTGGSSSYLNTYKHNNKAYIMGNFDSAVNLSPSKIYEFDGTNIKNVSFNFISREYRMASFGDTLLVSSGNKIYKYLNPGWQVIYTSPYGVNSTIMGLTVYNGSIFTTENTSLVKRLDNRVCVDSFATNLFRPVLTTFGNKVYLSGRSVLKGAGYSDIYAIENKNSLWPYFRLQYTDTANFNFLVVGARMYIHGFQGIQFNDINYGGIAEVNEAGLSMQEEDSLFIYTFTDNNKNGVKDNGESAVGVEIQEQNGGLVLQTNQVDGKVLYRQLRNEDPAFKILGSYNVDSCFGQSFTGAMRGGLFNTVKSFDTIYLPLWRKSKDPLNYNVRFQASPQARLDQNVHLKVHLSNNDCSSTSKTVTLFVNLDVNTKFISSVPAYKSITGNLLEYELTYSTDQGKTIDLVLNYPSNKYTIGEKVSHRAYLYNSTGEDPKDNMDTAVSLLVYSYDPNAKHSHPEGLVRKEVKNIRYHIDFQNEGNDYAYRVRVVDTLSLNMPVYAFQMVGASHPYKVSVKDNIVTWTFEGIYLQPKSLSEEASKGFIEFDAKVNGAFRDGDSIINSALIYFDNNEAIFTNLCKVKRDDTDNYVSPVTRGQFNVYPNPAGEQLSIDNRFGITEILYIYDVIGQRIGTYQIESGSMIHIDVSHWSPGVYILVGDSGTTYKVTKI